MRHHHHFISAAAALAEADVPRGAQHELDSGAAVAAGGLACDRKSRRSVTQMRGVGN
jgi:hypothetical protein